MTNQQNQDQQLQQNQQQLQQNQQKQLQQNQRLQQQHNLVAPVASIPQPGTMQAPVLPKIRPRPQSQVTPSQPPSVGQDQQQVHVENLINVDNPVSNAAQDPHAASIVNTSQHSQVSPVTVEPDGARSSTFNDPDPDYFVRMMDLTNPNTSGYIIDMSLSSTEEPPLA